MIRAGSRRPRMSCPRCGKMVSQVMGGNTAAHKCPHGKPCSSPKWVKGQTIGCPDCQQSEVQFGH